MAVYGCGDSARRNAEASRILSQYPIGSLLNSIEIEPSTIIVQLENKRGWPLKVVVGGYGEPDKFVAYPHTLVLVDLGENIVYLYFDEEGKLREKQLVGS